MVLKNQKNNLSFNIKMVDKWNSFLKYYKEKNPGKGIKEAKDAYKRLEKLYKQKGGFSKRDLEQFYGGDGELVNILEIKDEKAREMKIMEYFPEPEKIDDLEERKKIMVEYNELMINRLLTVLKIGLDYITKQEKLIPKKLANIICDINLIISINQKGYELVGGNPLAIERQITRSNGAEPMTQAVALAFNQMIDAQKLAAINQLNPELAKHLIDKMFESGQSISLAQIQSAKNIRLSQIQSNQKVELEKIKIENSLKIQQARTNWIIFTIFTLLSSAFGYITSQIPGPVVNLLKDFSETLTSIGRPISSVSPDSWLIPNVATTFMNKAIDAINTTLEISIGKIMAGAIKLIIGCMELGTGFVGLSVFLIIFCIGLMFLNLYNKNISIGWTGFSLTSPNSSVPFGLNAATGAVKNLRNRRGATVTPINNNSGAGVRPSGGVNNGSSYIGF